MIAEPFVRMLEESRNILNQKQQESPNLESTVKAINEYKWTMDSSTSNLLDSGSFFLSIPFYYLQFDLKM